MKFEYAVIGVIAFLVLAIIGMVFTSSDELKPENDIELKAPNFRVILNMTDQLAPPPGVPMIVPVDCDPLKNIFVESDIWDGAPNNWVTVKAWCASDIIISATATDPGLGGIGSDSKQAPQTTGFMGCSWDWVNIAPNSKWEATCKFE